MQTINLDISRKHSTPPIYAKQSEVGRKFLAVITDNGIPYNIPADALLSVWYEGDTDAGNYSSIEERSAFSIDGNKVTVELVAQMLLKPGSGNLCLSITHGNGGETNTWNIPYSVEYKPGAGSSVPTEYYTAFQKMASLVAQYSAEAKRAAESLEILVPIGYTFQWSPVDGNDIDLSTAEKVSAHFGFGTWEQIKDKFLLGAGDTYVAGATGGEAEHKLTIDEMPKHRHAISLVPDDRGVGNAYAQKALNYSTAAELGPAAANEEVGGNQPFNNMPPYLAVYIWKRVA